MNFTVDLHTHILPLVDDGAENFEVALKMMGVAAASGTTDIVLTPHYLTPDMRSMGYSKKDLIAKFEEFKTLAIEKFPEISIYLGSETFAITNIEDYIVDDKMLTLNGTNYILLELPFDDQFDRALSIVQKVNSHGYQVILAHAERYEFIQKNPRRIISFLKEGVLVQINSTSILGQAGFLAQDVALSFLENRLAAVIASDAHSVSHRPADLSEVYSFICSEISPDYAEALFYSNPRAILNGVKL